MAVEVAPFLHPIPPALLKDPATRGYFEYLNRHLHDSWVRSGGGTDAIAMASEKSNQRADTLLIAVADRIELGDPLTIDDTGFTIDNSNFTIDQANS